MSNDQTTEIENSESEVEVAAPETELFGRTGIFGGTFSPMHMGHMNLLQTVQSRMNLEKIYVVPASQNPLKPATEGPTDAQRLEMLKVGTAEFEYLEVDDQEIKRGGKSFTVDTITEYAKKIDAADLFLIVGLDAFEELDRWKDFEKILTLANLIVVTRPNHTLPFTAGDLPEGIQPLVAVFDRQYVALNSGRSIEFVRLNDQDVSSTDIRKRMRSGQNVDRHLDLKVEEFLRANQIFAPIGPKIGDYEAFTRFCAQALWDKKAIQVRGFDLSKIEAPTEFTLVASGTSTRHANSLAEAVQRAVKEEFNVLPQSVEGVSEGRWVVLDYGALIIHVFYDFVRQEYRLEDLWRAGRDLLLQEPAPTAANQKK